MTTKRDDPRLSETASLSVERLLRDLDSVDDRVWTADDAWILHRRDAVDVVDGEYGTENTDYIANTGHDLVPRPKGSQRRTFEKRSHPVELRNGDFEAFPVTLQKHEWAKRAGYDEDSADYIRNFAPDPRICRVPTCGRPVEYKKIQACEPCYSHHRRHHEWPDEEDIRKREERIRKREEKRARQKQPRDPQ